VTYSERDNNKIRVVCIIKIWTNRCLLSCFFLSIFGGPSETRYNHLTAWFLSTLFRPPSSCSCSCLLPAGPCGGGVIDATPAIPRNDGMGGKAATVATITAASAAIYDAGARGMH